MHKEAAGDLICMSLARLELALVQDERPRAAIELFGATEGVRLQNLESRGRCLSNRIPAVGAAGGEI
jgi:hypothetical protein